MEQTYSSFQVGAPASSRAGLGRVASLDASGSITLKGTVVDGSGNALPGASVALTNIATGLKKTFTTDEGGQFTFILIEPGFYVLEAQATGFKNYRVPRLQLEVGQAVEHSITLSPGDLQETVNIVANEPAALDTATSALGGIVGRQRVEVLPLNGRNVFQLAQLEIGVTTAAGSRGANPDLTASGEISVNGGRTLNTEALVDGIPLANIRAEAFNVFNRANFQTPATTFGAPNFGVITGTEDPRQVQFAARIYF